MKYILLFFLVARIAVSGETTSSCTNCLPAKIYISHFIGDRNGVTFGYQTIPGFKYSVESSTNLITWVSKTNFVAIDYSASHFFSSDAINDNKQQYFRVKCDIN